MRLRALIAIIIWLALSDAASSSQVTLIITRQHSDEKCTSGQISLNGKIVGYTLERPWQGNIPLISSIPAGTYSAFVRTETKDRWRIELKSVPNRQNIQLHVGNFVSNGVGCILIGRNLSSDLCTLEESQAAWDNFKVEFAKAAGGQPDSDVQITVIITDISTSIPTPASDFRLQLMASPELFPEEGAWHYGPESVRRADIGHAFLCIQVKTNSGLKEDCFGFYPKKRGRIGPVPAGDPSGIRVLEGIEPGEEIAFEATGRWCWGRGSTECPDADGTPGRPGPGELPVALPGQYFGKLIGRIGNDLFPIGSKAVITAKSKGDLYLLMNHIVGHYGNNTGAITVKVTRAALTIAGPSGVAKHEFEANTTRLSRVTESVTLFITEEQRRQIYQIVNQWNTKHYRLLDSNCIDFIHDVLVQLGFHPPKQSGYVSAVAYVKACRELGIRIR
jgi:hypothetical protein